MPTSSPSTEEIQKPKPDVIESVIGPFGRWQTFICLVIFLVKFSIAWHQLGIVILAPPANFTCSDKNISDPCDSKCPSYDYDTSIFTETIVTKWNLVCDDAYLASVAQMVFMLGILVGNIVFGYLSDRFGRRIPLVVAVALQVITGVAASFSSSLWVFILIRFFCALATGGTMLTSFVLVMEIVGKKYRTLLGVLFQIPFNLGQATLGLFGYFIRDWHYFQLAISIPSVILISYYWLVPESPRWLLTVGRTDEAIEVMQKAAKYNRLPTYSIKGKVTDHVKEDQARQSKGRESVLNLFKGWEMEVRSFCIWVNWIVIGLVFFGVAQFMGQISGDIFINVAISGLVQIPGNLGCIYLMDKIGRKWTLILSYALCSLSCIILVFVPADPVWVTTFLGCIGMMSVAVSFSIIYIYTGELYPTTLRNVGLGTASMFARVGSMVAGFVTGLSTVERFLPPLIFGILPIIAIAATFRLPETLHCQLPDTIEEAQQVGNDTNRTVSYCPHWLNLRRTPRS